MDVQQARQLTWTLAERPERLRVLIRDRDSKFTKSFDRVFESEGIENVRTPFRSPQANGVAERFVRTVRSECLDWLLIFNRPHLEQVVRVFIAHYNGHRHIEPWPWLLPNPRVCQQVNGEGPASVGAIDLVERFTSTPSPHDGVNAPYTD